MIRITEVRVHLRDDDALRGLASITLEGCFVVKGIKIIEDREGRLFVAMPNRRKGDGSWQDVAHPITPAFRKQVEQAVLGEYNRVLAASSRGRPASPAGPDDG